jgi:hypothetical protein
MYSDRTGPEQVPNVRATVLVHMTKFCVESSHGSLICLVVTHLFSKSTSLYIIHTFRTTLNSSRPDLSSVCLGWDHCCTPSDSLCLWPLDIKFLEIVVLSSHHFLRTTSNSSRLDLLSACLGWDHCCTLLPSSCAFDPVDIMNIVDSLLLHRYCWFPPPPPPTAFWTSGAHMLSSFTRCMVNYLFTCF